jgi:dCTP deaminase
MSILTGAEIFTAIKNKKIKIEGLKEGSIGTESIDLHLGDEMKILECNSFNIIDVKQPSVYYEVPINNNSFVLFPNQLYLAHTIEKIGSNMYHPQLHDKSSCMRLGISTHGNSGFGDCGFYGQWTLEIQVVKTTILYVGMAICQISFETLQGEKSFYSERKSSKYMNQSGATESKINENFS